MEEKTLIILNKTFRYGFGVTPFVILRNPKISDELKTLYILLLSYAWYNAQCFPGQETLAKDLGISRQSISKRLVKLKKLGLINWGKKRFNTNQYLLHIGIPEELIPEDLSTMGLNWSEADVNFTSHHNVTPTLHHTIQVDEDLTNYGKITIGRH